jgi:hydrogenase maturation protease
VLSIIGCGNLNRSDDGVGVVVAQRLIERLRRHPVPGARVFDCGTAGMEVMFAARGSDALLILDASKSGSDPGAIFDVPGELLAQDHEPTYSLHDFRWDHALSAGRKIWKDTFPKEVSVWLVEAESVGFGTELTPRVKDAADTLYQRALAFIAAYALRRHATETALVLTVKRGSLIVPQAVYARYFERFEGAVLFDKDSRLCVLPVESIAGGVLVKQRNAQGDRAIDLTEFLRNHGWDDLAEYDCNASWDAELGALSLDMPPRSTP